MKLTVKKLENLGRNAYDENIVNIEEPLDSKE